MPMTTLVDRGAIRAVAAQHIRELGLAGPPLDYRDSLAVRQLTLLSQPLEEILAASPLSPTERDQIDGFIHLEQRIVCLRGSLHPHQRHTGALHEVAHDVLPWQRDVLHRCPIFSLPDALQTNFEREANLFAAECTFFADRFVEEVGSRAFHLSSALALREDYGASFEATFRHYVECHPAACLLLVSRLVSLDERDWWSLRGLVEAALTFRDARVRYGTTEVHHRAEDWQAFDRAFDDVEWQAPADQAARRMETEA